MAEHSNDALNEGRETFYFTLRNPGPGSALGSLRVATNTIFESDQGVRFERMLQVVHEYEGELPVTVLRGNDLDLGPLTVDFATLRVAPLESSLSGADRPIGSFCHLL